MLHTDADLIAGLEADAKIAADELHREVCVATSSVEEHTAGVRTPHAKRHTDRAVHELRAHELNVRLGNRHAATELFDSNRILLE